MIVDMHAAHERICYEKAKASDGCLPHPTQQLLIPLVFSVNPLEMAAFEEHEAELQSLGSMSAQRLPSISRSAPFRP